MVNPGRGEIVASDSGAMSALGQKLLVRFAPQAVITTASKVDGASESRANGRYKPLICRMYFDADSVLSWKYTIRISNFAPKPMHFSCSPLA